MGKGIADKNLEQGVAQGQLIEKINMLKKLLVLKFSTLPHWAEQKIAKADATQLDQWSERLFSADTIEGIFK